MKRCTSYYFGLLLQIIGCALNNNAIQSYTTGIDNTNEVETAGFKDAKLLTFTKNPEQLSNADFLIIAAPTPIGHANQSKPDARCFVL